MRYLFGLVFGAVVGALITLLGILHNPLFDGDAPGNGERAALPLSVAGQDAVMVVRTATGYPWIPGQPAGVAAPDVAGVRSAVRVMLATAGAPERVAYIARLSALTRDGRPLFGELIERSVWHVVVPGGGSFVAISEDDLWGFVRQMVMPLARGDDFRGKLAFGTTVGPDRGAARVIGLSGEYAGRSGQAELSQLVRRVSRDEGMTDGESTLWVSF